mgnify:CR=1 FL=1
MNYFVFNAINDSFLSNLIQPQGTALEESKLIPETQDPQSTATENSTTQTSGDDNTLNYEADNEKGTLKISFFKSSQCVYPKKTRRRKITKKRTARKTFKKRRKGLEIIKRRR